MLFLNVIIHLLQASIQMSPDRESSPKRYLKLYPLDFPGGASGKGPACQCRRHKRRRFGPWVGKIPWRRAQQPSPVFLPGEHMDRRARWVPAHGVEKNWIPLKWPNAHTCTSYPALFFLIVLTILWATRIYIYILPSCPLEYMFRVGVGGQDFVFFTQCYIFRRVTRYKVDTQIIVWMDGR